jgi:hypothetical protein
MRDEMTNTNPAIVNAALGTLLGQVEIQPF